MGWAALAWLVGLSVLPLDKALASALDRSLVGEPTTRLYGSKSARGCNHENLRKLG